MINTDESFVIGPDGKATFVLDYPINAKGWSGDKLVARRPKMKDMRLLTGPKAEVDAIQAQNTFLAQICEVPPIVFDEMDTTDYRKFAKYIELFTQPEKTDET